jgi:hypothetical protein
MRSTPRRCVLFFSLARCLRALGTGLLQRSGNDTLERRLVLLEGGIDRLVGQED